MSMTDPLADLLTRIRNANRIGRMSVDSPASNLKRAALDVLKREGFIRDFKSLDDVPHPTVRIYLKYGRDRERVIRHLQRVSKPGCRIYTKVKDMLPLLNGQGVRIVSTPRGVMSDRECRQANVGGEVLAEVW
ncbi:MAG: 30S ribosomal protein S8 [Planctomycetes bacterium]|jgi:small subunit ribosomal protein S8|nr:30S ribosomal protein S8 [Planctomycetota bacterium]